MTKVILIHGNGGCKSSDFWFPYVKAKLEILGLEVIAKDFPDRILARSQYWIPFLRDDLKADKDTIVIGHSSGAICAMRFAEQYPLLGSVLVGSYHSHLGIDTEKQSGYFDSPWNWDAIRKNQKWIIQFASTDDPWIPIEEPRYLHDQLKSDYYEYTDRGHFGGDRGFIEFPECVDAIRKRMK